MGQKTHPLGFRLGITQEHKSKWYTNFSQYPIILEEDDKIRTYLNTISKVNNISNVKFFTADLYKSFLHIVQKYNIPKPDVMIIDPPRSGMHPTTVDDVIKLSPNKIVYVSCNPATQVRDIKLMVEAGFKLSKTRPVDMFPHTFHIENVALLQK